MHTLRPFRAWCQKVLPLVYDDSLSYYELLCKVLKHLNMTIEDVNELKDLINGDFDIENLVTQLTEDYLDQMVSDGTFDQILARVLGDNYGTFVPAANGNAYQTFDFSGMAAEIDEIYNGDLSRWNASYTRSQWLNMVNANHDNMFNGNAWLVSGNTYSPYYVWKARKNYQTTHQGGSSENKYGTVSSAYYGEKTFLILMGERGSDKIPEAVFFHLFQKWLAGKYNGKYILDNYNFIIVPMVNYTEYDSASGADSLHNLYNNGFVDFNNSTTMNDRIESWLSDGIPGIIELITGSRPNRKWKYAQKIVTINLREYTWGVGDNEDLYPYGMVVRGHYTREEHSVNIIYDGSMSAFENVKLYKPGLYADDAFSQIHLGPLARHSLIYAAAQNGYRGISVELPAKVGLNYHDVASVRATENSFFLSLNWLYSEIMASMKYLDQPVKRAYGEMMTLGFFSYNTSIDTNGEFSGEYRPVYIDDLINGTPPGAYTSFAIPALTYVDGNGDTQLFDMSKEYIGLPSTRSGELHIRRGGNNYNNDANRGIAIYTPYYDNDKWYYCKVYQDGTHSQWYTIQSRTAMEYCIARSDNENAVTTPDGDRTKIALNQADHQWSTIGYFGISDGGIHIRKHGLYLISGGVQISSGAGTTRLDTVVSVGADYDNSVAVASESVPADGSFVGGIGCTPRIVEIQAERWVYLSARTTGADGSVTRNGANTFLQALLVRELN